MTMTEATETFGKMLRWNEQPKDADQAEKTVFIGNIVGGYYTGKKEGVGQNNSTVYEITMKDSGEKYSIWGSGVLDGKFEEIPLNCEIRITCLGTQQPKTAGGRAYLGFKVEFDKDSVKPANLVSAGETSAATATPAPAAPVTPVAGTESTTAPVTPAAPAANVAPAGDGF